MNNQPTNNQYHAPVAKLPMAPTTATSAAGLVNGRGSVNNGGGFDSLSENSSRPANSFKKHGNTILTVTLSALLAAGATIGLMIHSNARSAAAPSSSHETYQNQQPTPPPTAPEVQWQRPDGVATPTPQDSLPGILGDFDELLANPNAEILELPNADFQVVDGTEELAQLLEEYGGIRVPSELGDIANADPTR